MDADKFCKDFEASGQMLCPIEDVVITWKESSRNNSKEDVLGFDSLLAALIVDANTGDGLLDEISPELLEGFAARRGENFDSYDEVRAYLQEMVEKGHNSILGVINQIKGQLGELAFKNQAGGHAYLAHSTNQEAWDVAIVHPNAATEYVQVKIYQSADEVVKMMLNVQQKVTAGIISDGDKMVDHVNFAVNDDIVTAVYEKAAQHPELLDIKLYAIPMSNAEATGIVVDGFNNVGPNELAHLFNEWFDGTLTVACIHGMVNAFLVYKGSSTVDDAIEATLFSAALSSPGVAAAQATAWLLSKHNIVLLSGHPIIAAITAGMLARTLTKRWYESRKSIAESIWEETEHIKMLTKSLIATSRTY
jgi:hypothetical protein